MNDIITERSGKHLADPVESSGKEERDDVEHVRDSGGYLNEAAKDDQIRVVLWHGAGDSFCAGNDMEDFLKNPPGPGETPQARLMNALINFDKPLVAAVQAPRSAAEPRC